jgi:Centromere DNA-binding protein complex CBF3 subunit, domain 2
MPTVFLLCTAQVIERLGRWQMNAMQKSYLKFFKPDGLLVLGGWSQAAQKHFDIFWSERFCLDIPSDLVEAVFPFLGTLQAQVEKLGAEATTSMRSVPQVMQYLAVVLVQDACELADTNPSHPVYTYLKEQETFRCGNLSSV